MFDRGDEVIEFSAEEVAKFFSSAYDKKMLAWLLRGMSNRMTKMGFKFISEQGNKFKMVSFAIFPTFEVNADINEKYDDDQNKYTLRNLKVRVNTDFLYLFNELIGGKYTKYELLEFMDINGKYSKRLYMLLKQFRNTGVCATYKNNWDDFLEIMNIPKKLKMCDIDKELKKAIAELTKPRNLFDQERIPFQNLKYEKIKGAGRGQGGKVIGIVFTFKSEPEVRVEFKEAQQKLEQQEQEQNLASLYNKLNACKGTSIYVDNQSCKIDNFVIKIDEVNKSFKRIEIMIINEKKKNQMLTFDTEQEFFNWYESVKE